MSRITFFRMETLDWMKSWPCKSVTPEEAAKEAKLKAKKEKRGIRLVHDGGFNHGYPIGYFYP